MRYDVFISYSSIDQKIAEGVCAYLEQQGIRCFVAYRDIPRGTVWATAIVEALEQSRMMVVLFSKNFNMSKQVEREIELASDSNMPILTFRLCDDAFRGAKKYYLQNLNWIDAFPNPERSFGALYGNVSSLLGNPVSGGGMSVKKETPKSHDSNKSNRFLWIVIVCLSVALVGSLIFNNRTPSESNPIEELNVVNTDTIENSNLVSSDTVSISEIKVDETDVMKRVGNTTSTQMNEVRTIDPEKSNSSLSVKASTDKINVVQIAVSDKSNSVSSRSTSAVKMNIVQTNSENDSNLSSLDNTSDTMTVVQTIKSEINNDQITQSPKEDIEAICKQGIQEYNNKNYSEAFKWLKKTAEQGYYVAQYMLGVCYQTGNGVSKDLSESFKWYKKSAEQGYSEAQLCVGNYYEYGTGVLQNLSEAIYWYNKSAEQGNAQAQYNLGLCYESGIGISKDLSEAVRLYKKSAEQGNQYAQFRLGYFCEKSNDLSEAVKWYKKSADQGYKPARSAMWKVEKMIAKNKIK